MGLLDRLFGRQEQSVTELREDLRAWQADLRLAVSRVSEEQQKISEAIKERRKTLAKPLMYSTPVTSGSSKRDAKIYHGPVHDLSEIARAMDVEPYANQSVRKHREQILKEGYNIVGEDDEMIDYVKRRLFEMEMASGVTTEEVLRDFVTSLVAYGTSFIVKKRDKERSSGNRIRLHGKTLEPMAALYHLDPTATSVALNDHGHPVRWKQTVDESVSNQREKLFDASDVVVATVDKKPGFVFGTPYILPVLDDIRALRRLEELAEVAARKYAFPAIHYKVGSEKDPPEVFENGTTEIELIRTEVENMRPEGGLVTSYRVEGDVVAAGREVFDIHPYIQYFEERVLGGLRLSPVDLGRGDVSKASAGAVSQSLQDSSKDFQAIIQNKLTYDLIFPLLMEGGFNVDQNTIVRFEFPLINREEERANQQHGMDMCNNSVITCTEFRQEFLGKKQMSDEDMTDTKDEMAFQRDKELAKDAAAAKAAQQQASGSSTSKKSSSGSKSSAAARTVATKVRPANQSGKKPIKTAITANNNFSDAKDAHRLDVQAQLVALRAMMADYYGMEEEDRQSGDVGVLFDNFVSFCGTNTRSGLTEVIQQGVDDAREQLGHKDEYRIPKKSMDRFFKNYIEKSMRQLTKGSAKYMETSDKFRQDPKVGLNVVFTQLDEDLTYLLDRHVDIAYRFGFARALRGNDCASFYLVPDGEAACPTCNDEGGLEVDLTQKDMPYSLLLATHEDCQFLPWAAENNAASE